MASLSIESDLVNNQTNTMGSSALDFYQHTAISPSLYSLCGLISPTRRTSTPNAAAVQYLEGWLPWLSKPFRVIVPSHASKEAQSQRCALPCRRRQFQQDRYFALRKDSLLPSPGRLFLQSNWSHDLAEVIFKGKLPLRRLRSNASFRHRLSIAPFLLLNTERIKKLFFGPPGQRGCAMTRRAAPWILG